MSKGKEGVEMDNERTEFTAAPDLPTDVREPLLRLVRQLNPKEPLPPTSIAAVEAYKRKFLRHLQHQLSAARDIIFGALIADGRSAAAAHAEVERFSREVSAVVKQFGLDAISDTIRAEEIEQAQADLAAVQPLQEGGRA